VLPALLLNYFGQGALLMEHAESVMNPFFELAPAWGLYPLVALSTVATIIASQALISGAFSLTQQAIQLDYLPRFTVVHTSGEAHGQIYVPWVNWGLMILCIVLVLAFQSSADLAEAYGMAVTGTMAITSLLFYAFVRERWHWPRWRAAWSSGSSWSSTSRSSA
jgi:KUP system potassium uptake protein